MDWDKNIIHSLEWGKNITRKEEKLKIANVVSSLVKEGDIIGVGSGSTSFLTLQKIAKRIKDEKLNIKAIPTSLEIKMACSRLGIPITSLYEHKPDWTFDGADEIDPDYNLIKGRGGAMFKEKLLMRTSPKTYILADASKMVEKLGTHFAVPVEIYPEALTYVEEALWEFKPQEIKLRMADKKDGPIITENGNLILDVRFSEIHGFMESAIKAITGVVESGLFLHYNVEIIS